MKYSGGIVGEKIQKTNEGYYGSDLASNDIINSGKTDKTFEDALKRYYKHVYPESTDQEYKNYKKALSGSQKGDLESEMNAFYSKEALLYGGYLIQSDFTEKAITAQAILESALPIAGFGISKGIARFGSKGVRSVSGASSKLLDSPAKSNGTLNIGAGSKPIQGAYNIDLSPKNNGVHAGNATNLKNIATGSQSKIVIENPHGYDPLNPEILRGLQEGDF